MSMPNETPPLFDGPPQMKKKDKMKKQNEGLQSPAEKTLEEKDVSPEIHKIAAPASLKTVGRRALFAK